MCGLISIVCPVYNAEPYLNECIESILTQTDTNWELILIDDGSTDNSYSICKTYSKHNDRIKVLHENNSGQMKARINGIEHSTGDFVLFLDSDDLLCSNAIKVIRTHLFKRTGVDALLFNAAFLPSTNNDKVLPQVKKNGEFINTNALIKYAFCEQVFGYLWMYCFKKNILLDVLNKQNNFLNIRYTEDCAFVFNVLNETKSLDAINEVLYHYRNNSNSITHSLTVSDRIDRYRVYEYIYSSILHSNNELAVSGEVASMVSWAMFSMLSHIDNKHLFNEMFKSARDSVVFKNICKFAKTNSREFKFLRFLLKINCPWMFYTFSHKKL